MRKEQKRIIKLVVLIASILVIGIILFFLLYNPKRNIEMVTVWYQENMSGYAKVIQIKSDKTLSVETIETISAVYNGETIDSEVSHLTDKQYDELMKLLDKYDYFSLPSEISSEYSDDTTSYYISVLSDGKQYKIGGNNAQANESFYNIYLFVQDLSKYTGIEMITLWEQFWNQEGGTGNVDVIQIKPDKSLTSTTLEWPEGTNLPYKGEYIEGDVIQLSDRQYAELLEVLETNLFFRIVNPWINDGTTSYVAVTYRGIMYEVGGYSYEPFDDVYDLEEKKLYENVKEFIKGLKK